MQELEDWFLCTAMCKSAYLHGIFHIWLKRYQNPFSPCLILALWSMAELALQPDYFCYSFAAESGLQLLSKVKCVFRYSLGRSLCEYVIINNFWTLEFCDPLTWWIFRQSHFGSSIHRFFCSSSENFPMRRQINKLSLIYLIYMISDNSGSTVALKTQKRLVFLYVSASS